MNDAPLQKFDLLAEAAVNFPAFADMCFAMVYVQRRLGTEIEWLDAANRLLSIPIANGIWEQWLLGASPEIAYKLAISHMILGNFDNVITSVAELNSFVDRYEEALRVASED